MVTNWRRGLFRSWLFGGAIWVLLMFSQFIKMNWPSGSPFPVFPMSAGPYIVLACIALGIPLAVLLIGLGWFWTIDGFKPDDYPR